MLICFATILSSFTWKDSFCKMLTAFVMVISWVARGVYVEGRGCAIGGHMAM